MGIFDHKNLEKYSRQLIIEKIGLEGQKKFLTHQYVLWDVAA